MCSHVLIIRCSLLPKSGNKLYQYHKRGKIICLYKNDNPGMIVYEILQVYKPLFVLMARNGISCNDFVYLDMYFEYTRLKQSGMQEKETYKLLSKLHKISASTIRKKIALFNSNVVL